MKKTSISFISLSLVSFLSIISSFSLDYQANANIVQKVNMEYLNISDKNGHNKKFSRLIMGTDHLLQSEWKNDKQKEISEKEFNDFLDESVKLGINTFDSSPIYVGDVESKFGKWLKSRNKQIHETGFYYSKTLNPDREVYTISKGGFPFDLYNFKKLESGTHSKEILDLLISNRNLLM